MSIDHIPLKKWSDFVTSIWRIPGEDKKLHPAAFPESIADRLIKMFSFAGEYVLDPFVGVARLTFVPCVLGSTSPYLNPLSCLVTSFILPLETSMYSFLRSMPMRRGRHRDRLQ